MLILSLFVAILSTAVFTHSSFKEHLKTNHPAEFHTLGQDFFETYAPAEIPREFAVSFHEEWAALATHLDNPRETDSPAPYVTFEREARTVLLPRLRALPPDYADWLAGRLDEIVVAKPTASPAPPLLAIFLPAFERHAAPAPTSTNALIPMYDVWVSLLRDQPRPKRADEFLPNLKRIFAEEGVPEELAWIPEIESMFNPRARNPGGARGLFQLMPVTARAQGLRLRPYDERTNPEKSARAAASLLRQLHGVFDSWPLALAAYNAGEGCVRRTLKAGDATTFAEIADELPIETRLYVPKVLATLAVREGVAPGALPAPRYIAQTGF